MTTTDQTISDDAPEADAPEEAVEEREPMRFDSTALDPTLIGALADKGFHTAFPIQELTLEMGIRGQDIIGQARTGTGKTLGFGLPLLHRIDPDKNFIQALIVAPTRELTAQVAEDLQIGSARGLNVTAVYGGVPIDPQFDALKTAHVVVGTPGRLLDHLNRGTMDLSRVTELVLDEADEMLDMGFLPDVERLMAACPSADSRHTSLFSATMAPAIVSLARRYMNSPSFLHAKSDEPQTAELVEQHFFLVHRMDKPRVLARIMQQEGREGCYVFSRTKAMCDRLVTELEELGVKSIAIHGDLRQATREKNLDKFRSGEVSILVATEVAARGLDVDNVTHVVNYDCPDDDKMYLHRIGRTARAGREGVAITFAQFNEVERLNVIRKTVGAYDGDLKEIFSTSAELQEIFDLPDETPWAHLSKKITPAKRGGSSKGGSSRSDSPKGGSSRGGSSKGGSSRDDGRGSSRNDRPSGRDRDNDRDNGRNRDDDGGGRNRDANRDAGRDAGRDRSETKTDDRPSRKPRADRDAGRDAEAKTDDRPSRKPRESRDEDRPTRKPRADRNRDDAPAERAPRDRDSSRDSRDSGDDNDRNDRSRGARDEQPATRSRTRTRTRTTASDDRPARNDRGGRDANDGDGRSRDGGDRNGRGRGDRDRNDRTNRDAGRDQDGNRAGRDDEDQPQARPRARRRARGGRGAGEGTGSSSDDGKSRGAGHGREAEGRTRTSSDRDGRDREGRTRDAGDRDGRSRTGRDRDGRNRDTGDRDGRNRDGGDRNRGERDGRNRDDNDRDRKGGRGGRGRNSRGGSSRSQGGRSSGGGNSSRGGGNADRDRSSSSSQRQPARTTAERRTTRGDDARGEGTPRLARRVEVENLP